MEKAFINFRRTLSHICDGLELIAAAAVGIGVIIACISISDGANVLWETRNDPGSLSIYLTLVFNLVIGIEFMKMLCRPHTGNIIEILIFLEARHMIVSKTTPLEDLLAIIGICILFFFRRFMLATKPDDNNRMDNFLKFLHRGRDMSNSTPPAPLDDKKPVSPESIPTVDPDERHEQLINFD